MRYVNRLLALPVLVLLLVPTVITMMIWLALRKIDRRATVLVNRLLNLLLIAFVAVLAFGSYLAEKRDYRTQFSLHGLAVTEKLRSIYPDMFE